MVHKLVLGETLFDPILFEQEEEERTKVIKKKNQDDQKEKDGNLDDHKASEGGDVLEILGGLDRV